MKGKITLQNSFADNNHIFIIYSINQKNKKCLSMK